MLVANTIIATDTFETWVTRTNQIATKINDINPSVGTVVSSNTVTANQATFSGLVTHSANVVFNGANTNVNGTRLTVSANTTISGANTRIIGTRLVITSNTAFGGPIHAVGLATTSNNVVTAINEVRTAALSASDDAVAFAIALG